MPAPSGFSPVRSIPASDDPVNAAFFSLTRVKYGGALGTAAALTYSFPFSENDSPSFRTPYGSFEEVTGTSIGFNDAQRAATSQALARWADVAQVSFTEVQDAANEVGDLRLAFSSRVRSADWGYTYEISASAEASDIWVGLSAARDTAWAPLGFNFFGLLHETGHALGFKHPGSSANQGAAGGPYLPVTEDNLRSTVMSYALDTFGTFLGQAVFPTTPMVLDIKALQALYGANQAHATEDTRYVFDPTVPIAETVWDAGGTDTLFAGDFTTDCTLDLRPGHYSSLRFLPGNPGDTYDGSDNLGIAYDCLIENAVTGSGDDLLTGNDGANELDGGLGADTLAGGLGDDLYRVDNVADVVLEEDGSGTDVILSTLSWDLASNPAVEMLFLDGSAFFGRGNQLDNVLIGNPQDNELQGQGGNDYLEATAGRDTLDGGDGNDTVSFRDASLPISVRLGNSNSCVALVDGAPLYTLVSVENLSGGRGNDILLGNAGSNVLFGDKGADTLNGRSGHDTLSGGGGRDFFVFDVACKAANADVITDFRPGFDKLLLDDDIFTKLQGQSGGAPLAVGSFHVGAEAVDGNDFLVFNPANQTLWYDSSGGAAGGARLVATLLLTGTKALGSSDFLVIT